ncbi:MAG: hypothetical protein ABSB80_04330 [Methanoregula sp.]|jgi:hypothetical protein|uniref:hypothetical protein n=1 Tax=Methanoregula sp. TaxID=2052170 RepID=UPI003D0BCC33
MASAKSLPSLISSQGKQFQAWTPVTAFNEYFSLLVIERQELYFLFSDRSTDSERRFVSVKTQIIFSHAAYFAPRCSIIAGTGEIHIAFSSEKGLMKENGREFRNTKSYRIWIDKNGTGHIRIVKRINFSTFISLCRETYLAIDRTTDLSIRIIIYVPRSLYDVMSENVREFIMFCRSCTDAVFELSVIGE